jgi:hypothetical protein
MTSAKAFAMGMDLGGGLINGAGFGDVFVAKYDSDGNHLWSALWGGDSEDQVRDLAVDLAGNVTCS